jgi:Arc/MetJ-type ribon-helix-helix transcriptional regulator
VTFLLPEAYLEGIERLIELGRFQSRSEAVRFAVKEMIKRELWRIKAEKTIRETSIAKIKV